MSTRSSGSRAGRARKSSRSPALPAAARAAVEALESRTLLTTVLSATADTYIRNNSYADVNFGSAPYLIIKNPNGGDARAALIKFDLSSVGQITSGILRATASLEFPEATPYTMSVFPVSDTSWVEGNGTVNSRNGNGNDRDNNPPGEITWNGAGAIFNAAVGSGALASATINRYGMQTYSWDLTSYLQQQKQAGHDQVSFLLYTQEQGALWTKILSRESGPYGPSLVINGNGPTAPVATVSAPDLNDPGIPTVPVSVTYSGEQPIDPGTINAGNITVQGPAGTLSVVSAAVSQQGSGNQMTAVYDVAAPGGGWVPADNGLYTVVVQPNRVRDVTGGAAISSEGTFRAFVDDSTPPTSGITSAPNVTSAGATSYQFTVAFSDDVAIDTSWIDVDNVGVTDPNGNNLTIRSAQVDNGSNGTPRTATYTVAAPGGSWNASDNGTYTINYRTAQVRDTAGNAATPSSTTFTVAIPTGTGDTTPPTASISAPPITSGGGATEQITVTYSDDVAIDASTIDVNDLNVSGPHGRLNVTGVSLNPSGNASTVVATYTVAAPGSTWNTADDGNYSVTLNPNKVRDTSGNAAASVSGGFSVNIAAPAPDGTPPTASISVGDIQTAGGAQTVTVVYSDNIAVSAASIDPSDLTVLTSGLGRVDVAGVSITPNADSSQITAVYTLAAPGGAWGAEDDGTYTVNLTPGGVTDTSGNPATAPSAGFVVNIPALDTVAPTATISAPDVLTPGGATEAITVTFADNIAIDISSISAGDVTVTGPKGPLSVTAVNVGATENSTPVAATFTVAAPGGSWGPEDNGTYTVTLAGGAVRDTSGNAAASVSNTFNVNASLPDTTPPSAQISAPDITSAGGATQTITVIYTDDVAVNAASIDVNDILVTGPAGQLVVTTASASDGNGSPLVATYTVAAPGGSWQQTGNGSYTISLNADQVADVAGNPAGGASGSFAVNVPAPLTQPTDPTFAGGNTVDTKFVTEDIITQSDGRILAVGHTGDLAAGQSQGVIERFNTDGSIDRTFANQGKIVSRAGVNEAYYGITLEDANHFIVAGTSEGDFVLARYDLSGNLDATFGTSGRVITNFGTSADAARVVAMAPGGLIVAGGDSDGNFAFARYDANGHLDPNFAQNGQQMFAIGSGNDGMGDMTVEGDGKIVAVGANAGNVIAVRLTPTGEADGTFGTGGLANVLGLSTDTASGADHSESLAIQGSGNILVANRTSTGHFGVARLTSGGALDQNFGAGGIATANFGGTDDADSIVVQPTGEIIVIGTSLHNGTGETAVAAFDPNGSPLTSYGTGGMLTFPTGMSASATRQLHVGDIVLRAFGTRTPDGRIVIGTTNEAVSATTSSTLRRIPVPGAQVGASAGDETPLGTFGQVGKKRVKLVVTDLDGTKITITLMGGTGSAFQAGDRIHLVINDLGKGVVLTITGKGGDGRVSLSDVTISGTLKSMNAKNSDLFGRLQTTGAIGKLVLGNIQGQVWSGDAIGSITAGALSGNVYASGAIGKAKFTSIAGTLASGSGVIGTITTGSLTNARILSGANLGTDGAIGGTGSDADSFGAGSIRSLKVTGKVTSSFVGAGVDPVDSTFGNDNDIKAGTGASTIRSIVARSADSASRFEAGAFGKVRLPATVNVLNDPRFRVLS